MVRHDHGFYKSRLPLELVQTSGCHQDRVQSSSATSQDNKPNLDSDYHFERWHGISLMSSYSTDLVISKLSNLNETQDSITSVSQCTPLSSEPHLIGKRDFIPSSFSKRN